MADTIIANSAQILPGTVFGGVALVMLIESMSPLRAESKAPLMRWVSNLALSVVGYIILFSIAPLLFILIARTLGLENTGLLHHFGIGYIPSFILTLLCLEFVGYWLHRASHAVPVLWRIHAVHHSDVEIDATTSLRHHPLEHVISTLVFLPVMIALGSDPLVLLSYNVLHAAVSAFNHGNFSLGQSADRILRLFIVTPDFHRVHHSSEQRYTDSNYASILPIFDYLFRSTTKFTAEQHTTMPLGLTYFRERKYSRLDQLLLMPFQPKFANQTVQAR
ncbi:Fatty acid hydroxylase family protein [Candidatus Nitrotoga sp. BS]|uniref:sterol desaturase family protein n=1 Tax=Candidatus Nitrotoga sp. BS TaxID=2890408 RepID=UPI001EF31C55|nr:sterol desaturase family protein [Candidatus Nitrotoga sp. BS]CAH1207586.1 Fatty acid hydroxylase family protein [Candidatus Nitrotoga sp. BS]